MKRIATIAGIVSAGAFAVLAYKYLFKKSNNNETMSNFSTTSNGGTLPRGYRNNNPLNIRISSSNNWQGKVTPNTDGAFEQFSSMAYGFRAAFILIRNYINNYGATTVQAIISKWAPNNENNTQAYITAVCGSTGFSPSTIINPYNQTQMCKLVYAMAIVENGYAPNMSDVVAGWDLYLK